MIGIVISGSWKTGEHIVGLLCNMRRAWNQSEKMEAHGYIADKPGSRPARGRASSTEMHKSRRYASAVCSGV
ncbi:MAG: hypothetical protein A2498_16390 [Lentisphaerae bacterium RIFOXYC12_FULL_60_16]|nr:MAG: hypothetical protein A2498_16390 [Lentisphaerae bacterium RIFOXYC12_FULL_60_16]